MESLVNKGMIVINDIRQAPDNGVVIIRAHGEGKYVYDYAKEKNITLIDLTCPKILAIRKKINLYKEKYFVVIIGRKNHPETIANISYVSNGMVIESDSSIFDLCKEYEKSHLGGIYIISQTTISVNMFNSIVDKIKSSIDCEVIVDMTICTATENRQKEAIEIAKGVDAMIVIGGIDSSNTKELFDISKKYVDDVYFVSSPNNIDFVISNEKRVGVIAGASTPYEDIIDVVNKIQN